MKARTALSLALGAVWLNTALLIATRLWFLAALSGIAGVLIVTVLDARWHRRAQP